MHFQGFIINSINEELWQQESKTNIILQLDVFLYYWSSLQSSSPGLLSHDSFRRYKES